MRYIIDPVPKEKIKKELTPDKLLRKTNFGNNEIYIITAKDSPNTMLEIGRLRELTFRAAGGGTGKSYDIDRFDTAEIPYKQLVLWNPQDEEIIGGYRFVKLKDLLDNYNTIDTAFTSLFKLSNKFIKDYLPYTIELGRSFIVPNYQSIRYSKKSIYSLDNLWDGLGALVVENSEIKYFLGKITMYGDFNPLAKDILLYFMNKFFNDKESLITPYEPIEIVTDIKYLETIFDCDNYLDCYKILNRKIRELGENIPPLFNSYMNLSPSMLVFGTALNSSFGNVEETAIMITIKDIYEKKKERHIKSYLNYKQNKAT